MPTKLAVCEQHGLRFDPALAPGCVLCRRGDATSQAPRLEPRKLVWMAGAALAVVLAALVAVAVGRSSKSSSVPEPEPSAAMAEDPSAAGEESPDLGRPDEVQEPEQAAEAVAARPTRNDRAEQECSQGNYDACWSRAKHSDDGQAGDYYRRAIELAEPRCDEGEFRACMLLVEAYQWGKGVSKDPKKAREYGAKIAGKTPPKDLLKGL